MESTKEPSEEHLKELAKYQFRKCPGCGNRTINVHTFVEFTFLGEWTTPQFKVVCAKCQAHTKLWNTEEEAVAAWNLKPEEE